MHFAQLGFENQPVEWRSHLVGHNRHEVVAHALQVGDELFVDGAWAYPDLPQSAAQRVGREFAGYIAFAPGVQVGP